MADGVSITAGSGTTILTDDTGVGGHAQVVKLAISTDGSGTLIPADATFGLEVDVSRVAPGTGATNLGKAEDAAHTDGDVGVMVLGVVNNTPSVNTGDYATLSIATNGGVMIGGCTAHDSADAGSPVKIGAKAVSHGANPTSVTAADRTDLYANRAGVLFTIGGHPNVLTLKHTDITTAVTNASIIAGSANVRIVVTRITVTLDSASTVFPLVRIGFAASTTPTTTGVLASHGGVPAGGGFTVGDGSGIVGVSAAGDALLVTTTGNATGNGLHITVSYYTINEA